MLNETKINKIIILIDTVSYSRIFLYMNNTPPKKKRAKKKSKYIKDQCFQLVVLKNKIMIFIDSKCYGFFRFLAISDLKSTRIVKLYVKKKIIRKISPLRKTLF